MLMSKIKQIVKLVLSKVFTHFRIKSSTNMLWNRVGVSPLILHDIPSDQINHFKRLLVSLMSEWDFIDPKNFVSFIKGNSTLEKSCNMLTFDDGFYSNYIIAKEVLKPLGIKAIFFVPTEFIDSKHKELQQNFIKQNICLGEFSPNLNIDNMKPMSWENLSELIEMGHTIGCHSKNHLKLSKVVKESVLKDEIISSGNRIEEMLKVKVEHFAYPFGDIDSINKKALDLIRKQYKYIYSGVRGQNRYGTSPFVLRRESLDIGDSHEYNSFIVNGGLSLFYWRARRQLDAMVV